MYGYGLHKAVAGLAAIGEVLRVTAQQEKSTALDVFRLDMGAILLLNDWSCHRPVQFAGTVLSA